MEGGGRGWQVFCLGRFERETTEGRGGTRKPNLRDSRQRMGGRGEGGRKRRRGRKGEGKGDKGGTGVGEEDEMGVKIRKED